jgi:hypothetical protein
MALPSSSGPKARPSTKPPATAATRSGSWSLYEKSKVQAMKYAVLITIAAIAPVARA